jgi:hypothetical protein
MDQNTNGVEGGAGRNPLRRRRFTSYRIQHSSREAPMRALVLFAALAAAAAPAFAQGLPVPRTSRGEREVREINRSIQNQQRDLRRQQQDQIELNQLRQDLGRQSTTPSLTGPGSAGRICAPGQLGC